MKRFDEASVQSIAKPLANAKHLALVALGPPKIVQLDRNRPIPHRIAGN